MGKSRRTRTPSAGMEPLLVASAAELLEKEGPDALSVRRIATEAGVAPMGVYNHFESKFGIVDALFIQGFNRLRDALATIDEIEDPYEALRESGRRYRDLALAHPKAYQIMFLRAVPGYEPSDRAVQVAASAFDSLVTAVTRAMAAGVITEASPTETAQLIWANIHGWVSLELVGIGFVEDQEAGFERVCATLLAGLAPNAVVSPARPRDRPSKEEV
jgi:AcrR family transcriptional regulator